MTEISYAVQAHPSRSVRAHLLAAALDAEVVFDPDPSGRRSPWRTFRHLLATTPPEAAYRFQIQDDATPCPGLRRAVERAVAARPGRLLVFYVGDRMPRFRDAILNACRADLPWAELEPRHWIPAVATCWPRDLIDGILDYTKDRPAPIADDQLIGEYMKRIGHVPLASVPSLVEHLDDGPPVMGKPRMPGAERRAACYIGSCEECLDAIDWTLGPT